MALRSLQCYSGTSKHSSSISLPPMQHSPCMAGYTFSSSAHNNSFIYGIHRPTQPGVVFQRVLSLTMRDRSLRPLRTTLKREWIRQGNYHPPWQGLLQPVQVIDIRRFQIFYLLFTRYLKIASGFVKEIITPLGRVFCNLCK